PPSGPCRVFDFDNDLDVDTADETIFDTLYTGSTEITRQPARRTSANGVPFAHQGLRFDEETSTYQNRNRIYNPSLRIFTIRDPVHIGDPTPRDNCTDGGNGYGYTRSNPGSRLDASGLSSHVGIQQDPWAASVTVTLNIVMWGIDSCPHTRQMSLNQIEEAWNDPRRSVRQNASSPCCSRVRFKVNTFLMPSESPCNTHSFTAGGDYPCQDRIPPDPADVFANMGGECAEEALQITDISFGSMPFLVEIPNGSTGSRYFFEAPFQVRLQGAT
ncbi:MAG TPA: RHS repeat-associated core domain-containing protein, partial [Mycobacterium sp.]